MASFWSAENAFAKFQVVAKVEALKFVSLYKKGALNGHFTDAMTVIEIFDRLIALNQTTSTEKKVFQLGRSIVSPPSDSLPIDMVQKRVQL